MTPFTRLDESMDADEKTVEVELPGMWEESDLSGGEADSLEGTKTVDFSDDGRWERFLYALEALTGSRINEEEEQHLRILLSALGKYHERDMTHRGLWRYFGAIDSAHQLRAKSTRTYNNAIGLLKEGSDSDIDPVDDAIDAINYAVFYIRNVTEGNYG